MGTNKDEAVQSTEGDVEHDDESPQMENALSDNQGRDGEADIVGYDELEGAGNSEFIIEGMTFYLDDPTLERVPTPEMVEAVFYANEDSLDISETVKQHMKSLLNENLKDAYNGCISAAEEVLACEASDQEEKFDDKRVSVKQFAAENNYVEWRKNLMHSTYLDNIIEKRLKLWESEKRNGFFIDSE